MFFCTRKHIGHKANRKTRANCPLTRIDLCYDIKTGQQANGLQVLSVTDVHRKPCH